ncbi:MAG: polysaccharide deacetylase family protein [Clostridia bacterium]|nr:polysaccharide deacetylase family protein [Clostridia bacterium]
MLQFHVYPGGKRRIVTFSYDDGSKNDPRLVALFNKYGVKGTFHINSRRFAEMSEEDKKDYVARYDRHEVACHTVNHGWLTRMPASSLINEVMDDRRTLETYTGYPVVGMSYPSGDYDDRVIAALSACGIVYSRTTKATFNFGFPDNWLAWHPTCHHRDAEKPVAEFLARLDSEWYRPLLYIWGHSHEFKTEEDWERQENLVASLAGLEQVWYATNIEIYNYIEATRRVLVSADERILHNPSALDVWVERDKKEVFVIPAGETVTLP